MRVLFLVRGFSDYVHGFLNELVNHCQVYVVLANKDKWLLSHLDKRIIIVDMDVPAVRKIMGNIKYLIALRKCIQRIQPHVCHLHSGLIWEPLLLSMLSGFKTVLTLHDVNPHVQHFRLSRYPQFMTSFQVRCADHVIVHGVSMLKAAHQSYSSYDSSGNNKFWSIEHGIIYRYGLGVSRYSFDPGYSRVNIVFFGSLDRWKGIETLIASTHELAILLKNRAWRLTIAGAAKSGMQLYYRELCESGINTQVDIRMQHDQDVRELFRSADVLVLPYREASQSGVLQLGFAFGVPAVVTDVGGLPDVITDEKNGLLVSPDAPHDLARSIVRLIEDHVLRRKIINSMLYDREHRFSWKNIVRQTLAVYSN